jgi:hypothetical protein
MDEKYWLLKGKFGREFSTIRSISGLSLEVVSRDNMMSAKRLMKVEEGIAALSHHEFVMLVWYMGNIPAVKPYIVEYQMAIKELRKRTIPSKYAGHECHDHQYYKQGHIPIGFVRAIAAM